MKTTKSNPRWGHRRPGWLAPVYGIVIPLIAVASHPLPAQTALDEDSPWPRVRSTNGNVVTFNLPQVERWTSNSFVARAAVEVKPAGAKKSTLGVVWFAAQGSVDRTNRLVTLDRFEITKGRFPDTPDHGSNALALAREVLPAGARTVSLDYLITALGFVQAAAREGSRGLKHDPPRIIWATNRTVLVIIDGEPVVRRVTGTGLERVINTPSLLVRDRGAKFYLPGGSRWFAADTLAGPWSLVQSPPAEVEALSPAKPEEAATVSAGSIPRIIVSTRPAELLMTSGMPDYRPIRGTALLYAADSDSQLFMHSTERVAYLLLSGRWFKAASLNGPWSYVAPGELPADFAKIPPGSPQAIVLASVPGTPQAELALLANSIPTTATVNRRSTKIELTYDGEPKFKPIAGTAMSYAVNAQLPVIRTGDRYYAVDNAIWFVAASPQGPWEVAAEVPEEIYTIPPESPVYYATFVHVYDGDDENVETGYTAGYLGAYEDDGTMVYGTGCDYEPWYGEEYYYGWGWTYGYCFYYIPWYQWWIWRPVWSEPGGLRAALIENIYDRWQSRPGVTPHDRAAGAASVAAPGRDFSGFPALYGRFKGAARAAALTPPASTLALNPYSRPPTPARPGEVPRGAQLLANIRQSPGGGRDLYASPDGNVYLRKPDGWYRQQAGGNWSFFAAANGTIERNPAGPARGGQLPAAGGANRLVPNPSAPAVTVPVRDRVPDAGNRLPTQQVADLERQYYARTLSQMRSQNVRPAHNVSRPARGGGGRRR